MFNEIEKSNTNIIYRIIKNVKSPVLELCVRGQTLVKSFIFFSNMYVADTSLNPR